MAICRPSSYLPDMDWQYEFLSKRKTVSSLKVITREDVASLVKDAGREARAGSSVGVP